MDFNCISVKRSLLPVSALALGMGLTACSDSDSEALLQRPGGISEKIQVGGNPTFCTLPIEAKGKWTVSVVNEEADWLMPVVNKGTGNKQLRVAVDRNEGNDARSAQVRFSSEGEHVDFTIVQGTYDENAGGANSAADMAYASSRLGCGIKMGGYGNATSFLSLARNSSLLSWKKLGNESLDEIEDLVMEEKINEYAVSISNLSQLENQGSDLKASLSVNISYGMFKLGLNGDFSMYAASNDSTVCYAAAVTDPKYFLTLNTAPMFDYAEPGDAEKMDADELEQYNLARLSMLSPSFVKQCDIIVAATKAGTTVANYRNTPVETALNQLDKVFGPVIITDVTKGGSISIDLRLHSGITEDTMKINGKLDASFTSLFSLNMDAAASYLKESNSYTKDCTLNIKSRGGSLESGDELAKQMVSLISADATEMAGSINLMLDKIKLWDASITPADCSITNVSVIPIWEFFYGEAAEIVKDYMKSKYVNKEDGSCPYLFNIQNM